MILSDLEWLNEILNDTKRRVVSATTELLMIHSQSAKSLLVSFLKLKCENWH